MRVELGSVSSELFRPVERLVGSFVEDRLHEPLLGQVDIGDVVAAAKTRLDALEAIGISAREASG